MTVFNDSIQWHFSKMRFTYRDNIKAPVTIFSSSYFIQILIGFASHLRRKHEEKGWFNHSLRKRNICLFERKNTRKQNKLILTDFRVTYRLNAFVSPFVNILDVTSAKSPLSQHDFVMTTVNYNAFELLYRIFFGWIFYADFFAFFPLQQNVI